MIPYQGRANTGHRSALEVEHGKGACAAHTLRQRAVFQRPAEDLDVHVAHCVLLNLLERDPAQVGCNEAASLGARSCCQLRAPHGTPRRERGHRILGRVTAREMV
eukprot:562098-Rhodomonas_salina.1